MDKDVGVLLRESMRGLDELGVLRYAVEMTAAGHSSFEIFEILLEGIGEVDALYEAGRYFIADLMMAGHIMKSVMNKVFSYQGFEEYSSFGRIVIAAVRGDIHELGKDVIAGILRHNGFEVYDLGADVSPQRVTEAVREYEPNILILSGMMKSSVESMADTVAALEHAGLRGNVRILVGGAAVTRQSAEATGADAYSPDIKECLRACHEFMAAAAGEK